MFQLTTKYDKITIKLILLFLLHEILLSISSITEGQIIFRLLIVDDEENIREGLRKFIDWQEFEIYAVETAKNGLDALDSVRQNIPDLVICDVRMPKMDGIGFAKNLREQYPDCRVIFLSGYADKEYLKAAIQLKAVNYIEKPVNINEVKLVVQHAISELKEEIRQKTGYLTLQKNITDNQYLLRQEIALELLKHGADVSSLIEKFGRPVFNLPVKGHITSALIEIYWNASVNDEMRKDLSNSILKILNGELMDFTINHLAGFLNENKIILILEGKLSIHTPPQQNILDNFLKLLSGISNNLFTISVGCGNPISSIEDLPESFQHAQNAAARQFYLGVGKVFYPDSTSGSSVNIGKNEFKHFKDLLKKDKFDQADKFISDLTDKIFNAKDPDVVKIRNIYMSFMLILLEGSRELEYLEICDTSLNDEIWQEISKAPTLKDISEFIKTIIMTSGRNINGVDTANRKIYEIMKYIQEHYYENSLSTKTISEQSYLTQTYLCAFFKKFTGKTLNDYITEVRLEKAKELLKQSSLKLYEIAASVGYSDTHYFSMLFKRQFGCLPSEFRKRI